MSDNQQQIMSEKWPEIRLGFLPLNDAASLIVAKELGFFADQDLNVRLSKEYSWATIRDKLVFGELDAAQLLSPMVFSTTLGLSGIKADLCTKHVLSINGNAISLSNQLFNQLTQINSELLQFSKRTPMHVLTSLKLLIDHRQLRNKVRLRFAVVFPYSMHAYLLRYWLASVGIDVDKQVDIVVIPPHRMVEALENQMIDGYCVGEPWNSYLVERGSGVCVAAGSEVLSETLEKVLAVRSDWAQQQDQIHQKLIIALRQAAQWMVQDQNKAQMLGLVSRPEYLNLPVSVIRHGFDQQIPEQDPGASGIRLRQVKGFSDTSPQDTIPAQAHGHWILSQMNRWQQLSSSCDIQRLTKQVFLN